MTPRWLTRVLFRALQSPLPPPLSSTLADRRVSPRESRPPDPDLSRAATSTGRSRVWRTYFSAETGHRESNVNNFIREYISLDETRLNTATAQFLPAMRDIVGAITRVAELD